jgi:hypothetical protein
MPTATLAGQAIFGDMTRITAAEFIGTAAQADAFLGNPEGTTLYGPCERGPALAISGYLIGPDTGTVAIAAVALQGWAGQEPAPALLPTATAPGGWDTWPGCWFGPTDLAFVEGIVAAPGSGYQQQYNLILRASGGPAD